jgi:hypothetical protein
MIGVLVLNYRQGWEFFSSPPCPEWLWGPPSLLSKVYQGVQRPGREADHSPPSSVEVRNAWSDTSTSQYVFMECCLVKHRDNFTLSLLLPLSILFLLRQLCFPSTVLSVACFYNLPQYCSNFCYLANEPASHPTDWPANKTNSKGQIPFWEASSHSHIQEIPHLLCNQKVHYFVHKNLPVVPVLSQMYPVNNFPPYSLKIHSSIIFPSIPRTPKWPLPFRFTK